MCLDQVLPKIILLCQLGQCWPKCGEKNFWGKTWLRHYVEEINGNKKAYGCSLGVLIIDWCPFPMTDIFSLLKKDTKMLAIFANIKKNIIC